MFVKTPEKKLLTTIVQVKEGKADELLTDQLYPSNITNILSKCQYSMDCSIQWLEVNNLLSELKNERDIGERVDSIKHISDVNKTSIAVDEMNKKGESNLGVNNKNHALILDIRSLRAKNHILMEIEENDHIGKKGNDYCLFIN